MNTKTDRAHGEIVLSKPVAVARITYDTGANRLEVCDDSGTVVAHAQPFVVPNPQDTTRAHVSPPQWVPYQLETLRGWEAPEELLRQFYVKLPLGKAYADIVSDDNPLDVVIREFNEHAERKGWGVYTSAQEPHTKAHVARMIDGEAYVRAADIPGYSVDVPQPALSEYIHPAHCDDEEDDEPPSEWVQLAVYLAAAALAVFAVGVAYGWWL